MREDPLGEWDEFIYDIVYLFIKGLLYTFD